MADAQTPHPSTDQRAETTEPQPVAATAPVSRLLANPRRVRRT